MASRIEDYALIGDCQTAALVGRDGSIDWLCFPRFDSGACFASLLGTADNGRWLLAPTEKPRSIHRQYREGTLILQTDFETEGGAVSVIDFMPPRTTAPDVVRIVLGRRGRVKMHTELTIRFDYGSIVPWVRKLPDGRGIRATAGPDTLYCRTRVPLAGRNMHTGAEFSVGEGERVTFELTWTRTHDPEPSVRDANEELQQTEQWWDRWSRRCTYDGQWREAVLRSLITLKALTYAPTGGVVAAATTSLPEEIGGERNWDYRYCWLRDATFTLYALMHAGFTDEARAWRTWLVNAIAGRPEQLQIMYGVAGERRLTEFELEWLEGYEASKPVRVGNAAHRQRQLDVYGELMDTMHAARALGLPPDAEAWRVQRALVHFLADEWRKPDEGIWEVRGPKRQFTHSKVMAWVAFDRAVKAIEQFGEAGEAGRWRAARDDVRREVMAQGFNPDVNAFTQYYGSRDPDASLLMLPMVGFIAADDPRMLGTVDLIRSQLLENGLLRRYPTGSTADRLAGAEGAFLLCTFWLVDNLSLQGRRDEACEIFERLLSLRNDVGLLSEEFDPVNGCMLGNFPQAFSHVGLVNSALNLTKVGGPAQQRGES
jgi:GH15 family glucan-1,4-alpha-glucosidase